MAQNKYTLILDDKEIKLLLNALGKRPFEEVYDLIEKIVTSTSTGDPAIAPKTSTKKK